MDIPKESTPARGNQSSPAPHSHVTSPGKPAAHVPEPHSAPVPPNPPSPSHTAAAHSTATGTLTATPPPAKKPETFAAKAADIRTRLGTAAPARDKDGIAACYKDFDALKPGNPGEELEHAALSRLLAHHAPRTVATIKAIEAALDAGLAAKPEAATVKAEHPAVAKARADLAALKSSTQDHVHLDEDAEALSALEAKLVAVPPVDVPA